MSHLKIGFVLDDGLDSSDGVQQYVLTLGRWLTLQGHEVHYLVGETKRSDIPHLHSLSRNLKVSFNQNRLTIPLTSSRATIRRLLATEKFDVLHVQMPYSPFLAGRIIRSAPPNTAIVGTFHVLLSSRLAVWATRGLGWLETVSRRRLDRVISVSSPAQQLAKRTLKLDSVVIPNAVNLDGFAGGRRLADYAGDVTNIVFLGRLVKRKGAEYLIRAFAALPKSTKARLIIAGKGPLQPMLERLCVQLNVTSQVKFVGYVSESEKPDYLASAEVAVFPSTGGESFGIVLIEAMAAGAGVVLAGNNPGYATVMDQNSDWLVNPRDTQSFAAKLAALIEDRVQRQAAHAKQADLVKQYGVEVVGRQVLDVYEAVLRSKPKVR